MFLSRLRHPLLAAYRRQPIVYRIFKNDSVNVKINPIAFYSKDVKGGKDAPKADAGKKHIPFPCTDKPAAKETGKAVKVEKKADAAKKPEPKAAKAVAAKTKGKEKVEVKNECENKDTPEARLAAFKELQESYQCDDGKPIFLKMGQKDEILFKVTVGLAVLGILGVVHLIITLI